VTFGIVQIVTRFPNNIRRKRPSQKYILPEIRVNIFLHFERKLSMCKYTYTYKRRDTGIFADRKGIIPFYINHVYCNLLRT